MRLFRTLTIGLTLAICIGLLLAPTIMLQTGLLWVTIILAIITFTLSQFVKQRPPLNERFRT